MTMANKMGGVWWQGLVLVGCCLLIFYSYSSQLGPAHILFGHLPDLQDDPPTTPATISASTDNIMFVESSCAFKHLNTTPGGLTMTPRQACAVFSAAYYHPSRRVFIFVTCPLHQDYFSRSSEVVQRVLELANVWVVGIGGDAEAWFRDSPLEGFATKLASSSWPVHHASDALRMLLLWKYGGTYLDHDVIILKSLDDLGSNWAGMADGHHVAVGMINLTPGHRLASVILSTMNSTYSPHVWVSAGPGLLTSVLQKTCNLTRPVKAGRLESCDFTVLPPWEFYPVHYSGWKGLLDPGAWSGMSSKFSKSHSVHAFGKLSSGSPAKPGSAYYRLANQSCNPVLAAAESF